MKDWDDKKLFGLGFLSLVFWVFCSWLNRSLIPQVQTVLDALINQAGFRVSPQLYQRILALVQEP
ncbi:MAG: DUF3368 domain-containing protein [Synechococcales bacterium]|nr:DUF3368 domain-containing protein [Synechococcales bacterium]